MANEISITLSVDQQQAIRAIQSLDRETDKFAKDAQKGLAKTDQSFKSTTSSIFKGFVGAQLAVRAFSESLSLISDSFNDFRQFETGLIGVQKTTEITGNELAQLGTKFQELSKRIPASTNELLAVAKSAGQLGVSGSADIQKFTETIVKLGTASDISGDQAATSLTRVLNVTNQSIGDIDRLASTIVELGNNFAATESEIVRVTNEVARATAVYDVSAQAAAGLATALRSIGVRSELAGTVVGKSFRIIDTAVRDGGASLQRFAEISGVTSEQFQKVYAEDSVKAFELFIKGLGNISEAGGNVSRELEKVGLVGEGVLKVLPALANNSELLSRAVLTANKAFVENVALNREFEAASKSLDTTIQLLSNSVAVKLQRSFAIVAPAINETLKALTAFINGTSDFNKTLSENSTAVAGASAALVSFVSILNAGRIATVLLSAQTKIYTAVQAVFTTVTSASAAAQALMTASLQAYNVTGSISVATSAGLTAALRAVGISAGGSALGVRVLGAALKSIGIGLVIAAVAELASRFETLDEFINTSKAVFISFGQVMLGIADSAVGVGQAIFQSLIDPMNSLLESVKAVASVIDSDLTESISKVQEEIASGGGSFESTRESIKRYSASLDEAKTTAILAASASRQQALAAQESVAGINESSAAIDTNNQKKREGINLDKQKLLTDQEAGVIAEQQRAVELENIEKQNQAKIAAQRKFLQDVTTLEEENAIAREEARLLAEEQDSLVKEEGFAKLQEQLGTEEALRQTARIKSLENTRQSEAEITKAKLEAEKKRLDAEKKFNSQRISFTKLTFQEQVRAAQQTSALLTQAAAGVAGENSGIAKKAATFDAIINGFVAVQKALASAPPPLNFVNAALVGAVTVANVRKINSTPTPSFQDGGFVPGTSFTGDNVAINANSGEAILNSEQQREFLRIANGDNTNTSGGVSVVIQGNVTADSDENIQNLAQALSDQIEFSNTSLLATGTV